MNDFWQNKIKAFLHDPPDKALILFHKSHEIKRDEILHELGLEYGKHLDTADHISSAMQRLDIPKEYRMDDARSCSRHICFKGAFKPMFNHTLSGEVEKLQEIKDFIDAYGYERALDKYGFDSKIVKDFLDKNDWKKTYFLLWRYLPEKYPLECILPADTRIPDHSIWDHLDVTASISSCLGDLGLLSIKMPAVQEFISHSRKLSDLWASSHIYSVLIFEGIKSITEDMGPDTVIYPHLRENPMFDFLVLYNVLQKGMIKDKERRELLEERLKVANLPNTFLCFIPFSKAEEFARKCEEAIKNKWIELSTKVKRLLEEKNIRVDEKLWINQISSVVLVSKAWIESYNFDKWEEIKRELPDDLTEKQGRWLNFIEKAEKRSNYGHFYLPTYELLGTILTQNSRLWDSWEEEPITGKKCLMCGLRNAVVERREEDIYRYWSDHAWKEERITDRNWINVLKSGERLCAVCLVKRLYGRTFKIEFKNAESPQFESVVEVAGKEFIKKIESDYDFQLLKSVDIELIYDHEWRSDEKKGTTIKKLENLGKKDGIWSKLNKWWKEHSKPNKYYAILKMDGDRIGWMLSGEILPDFGEFLHPAFKKKITEWKKGEDLISTKRVLTPSHHIAISRAMKDFSIHKVPEIIEKECDGFLVYSGGDDILSFFPTDKVLSAAKELQDFFKKDFYEIEVNDEKRKIMGLGKYASMSAGIIFVHYKYPLYDAIEKVREAEKSAKNEYGRNAFCMIFIKHSGEMLRAGGKWDCIDDLNSIVESIRNDKVSHRFIYDLMEAFRVLEGDMLKAEIKRLLKRRKTEKATDEEVEEICGKITCLISKYEMNGLFIEDVGKALKILYDAYRGEVE